MSYIEQNWVDGETVIDAQHLNHIEQGIGRCSVSIQGLEAELGTQDQELTGLKAELELKIDSKDVHTKQQLDSKLSSVYEYKGSVATEQDLPESGEVGDVYNVESTGMNYGWSGTKWDSLGSFVDLGPYLKVEQADQKFATLTQLEALTTKVEGKQEQGDYLTVEQADDKFATKDSLDNYVFWTQFTAGADPSLRNTIQLANHDSISGLTVDGKGVNLIMVSRWDKVDIGSPSLIANLNAKDGVVQINDDKVIATVDQIPSLEGLVSEEDLVNYVEFKQFQGQNDEEPRLTIELANHDTISGKLPNGTAVNIGMVSKWGIVDLGSSTAPMNLNSTNGIVTINDKYVIPYLKKFVAGSTEDERYTLELPNFYSISGLSTEGVGANLIMMSKWDIVDVGSPLFSMNLNSKDGVVQINDDKIVATVDQIPSMLEIATSNEMVEMFTSMQTKIDNKVSELTYSADKIALDQTIETMQAKIAELEAKIAELEAK